MGPGKIVLIRNAVETLGYFSTQIGRELKRMGAEIYWIDFGRMYESLEGLGRFVNGEGAALLTFNFIGLSGEEIFSAEPGAGGRAAAVAEESGAAGRVAAGAPRTVWEQYGMRYVNILVDHPMYFHTKLLCAPAGMRLFCIDREHVRYVRRFYPGIRAEFLPVAGNELLPDMPPLPFEKRRYDLVFTANYVCFDDLAPRLAVQGPEYEVFYRGILDDLIAGPDQSVDAVMERHIVKELGACSDADKRSAMAGMALIDLCVRAYFRERILQELVDADLTVHVFGADWERMPCKKPRNLILHGGQVDSAACVQAVREAKLSLNVMPWFKDGAHDRVFTAMLQGTAVLTDDSRYLREKFTDGKELVFYALSSVAPLPGLVYDLLRDEERLGRIAMEGYRAAGKRHTWGERARMLF